jgi:hypothetical protein
LHILLQNHQHHPLLLYPHLNHRHRLHRYLLFQQFQLGRLRHLHLRRQLLLLLQVYLLLLFHFHLRHLL